MTYHWGYLCIYSVLALWKLITACLCQRLILGLRALTTWWRNGIDTLLVLLALCEENPRGRYISPPKDVPRNDCLWAGMCTLSVGQWTLWPKNFPMHHSLRKKTTEPVCQWQRNQPKFRPHLNLLPTYIIRWYSRYGLTLCEKALHCIVSYWPRSKTLSTKLLAFYWTTWCLWLHKTYM